MIGSQKCGITHHFEAGGVCLRLCAGFDRLTVKIKTLAAVAHNAPRHFACRQADFDTDVVFGQKRIRVVLVPEETLYRSLSGRQHATGIADGRAITLDRENCRETIPGEVRNETAMLVHQVYCRLKNVVQDVRQIFSAFGTLLHQLLRQAGKAAQIHEHGVRLQSPPKEAVAVMFLNEMWQEMFQNS